MCYDIIETQSRYQLLFQRFWWRGETDWDQPE